jgi:prepilin-type N-terminal cleavage/methylation domain-containing protein
MKAKISNKAGFALVEVMIVAAIICVFATIALCQVGAAHQQRPFEMTQALTRLKWLWAAISISSTLAACAFVWLRAPAQSSKRLQNLVVRHQAELQLQ